MNALYVAPSHWYLCSQYCYQPHLLFFSARTCTAFVLVKLIPLATRLYGLHSLFLFHGITCALAALAVWLMVPETKDKTQAQLADIFSQGRRKHYDKLWNRTKPLHMTLRLEHIDDILKILITQQQRCKHKCVNCLWNWQKTNTKPYQEAFCMWISRHNLKFMNSSTLPVSSKQYDGHAVSGNCSLAM